MAPSHPSINPATVTGQPPTTEVTVRNAAAVTQRPGAPLIPAVDQVDASLLEAVLIGGDLGPLQPTQRLQYYRSVCASLGLNPLTKPFEYLDLDGKLTLYTRRDATDQLATNRRITRKITDRQFVDGVYTVTALARDPEGREEEATGSVPLVKEGGEWKTASNGKRYFAGNGVFSPLSPADRANAMMKAETKAKRRVTLSICGLGFTDESELDTMANARVVSVEQAHSQQALPPPPITPAPPAKPKSTPPTTPAPRPHQGTFGAQPDDPPELKETLQRYTNATIADRIDMFTQLKTGLKAATELDDTYYEVLAGFAVDGHPVEHANQFKKLEDQQKCLRLLWITLANMMQPAE